MPRFQSFLFRSLLFVSFLGAPSWWLKGADLLQEGLVLHLDAQSIQGVNDGAPLTVTWTDRSESGLSAISVTGTEPTYVADAGSGYPAVRYDGVDQYSEVTGLNLSSGASIFIVFANKRVALQANYRDTLLTCASDNGSISLASSRSSSNIPDYPSFDAQISGVDGNVTGAWVNGHSIEATRGDVFANRFYVASATYSALSSLDNLLIGSSSTSGLNAGQNDIREILIYDRILSTLERHRVHQYLGSKYDIEVVHRDLRHPVESYPHVLASQQFGNQYSFGQDGIRAVDYARATLRQGGKAVKFRLSNKYANTDGFTAVSSINTLVELVRDQPEVKTILDMPLTDYVFWVSTFAVPSWQSQLDNDGLIPNKATQIYNEVYAMVVYLLETYSDTGKRFYIGNWEGDWMLSGEYRTDPNTIPQNRIQGMIDWANIRQQAVDDAKANTAHTDVDVWFYLEMNKADWMRDGLPCVANNVIPAMPKLDMISISSYSVHKDNLNPASDSRIHSDLDQVQALLDAKPDASIEGSRLMIGEYGWQYNDTTYANLTEFAQQHVDTARSFLSWQGGTVRFLMQWQFFNQALKEDGSSKEMNQITPNNELRPLYFMHENFLRSMRRWVDDYYTRTGSLPSDTDYAAHADYVLSNVALAEYEPTFIFSNYEDWRAYHFVDPAEFGDSAISGPFADPYQSQISNVLRYGLGLPKFGQMPSRMPQIRVDGNDTLFTFPLNASNGDLTWVVQQGTTLSDWNSLYQSTPYNNKIIYSDDFESITSVTGNTLYSFGYDKDGGGDTYGQLNYGTWYKPGSTTGNNDIDGDGDLELRPNLADENNAKMWGILLDPSLFSLSGSGNYELSVDLIGADSGNSRIYLWYGRNFDALGANDLILDVAEGGFTTYSPLSGSGGTVVGEIFKYEIPDETVDGQFVKNFNYTEGDALALIFASYNTSFAYDNLSIKRKSPDVEGLTFEDGFLELDVDPNNSFDDKQFFRLMLNYSP